MPKSSSKNPPHHKKLYAGVPPGQSAQLLPVDPYLIAGKVTEDAVLGYHTALELMGLAYSSFNQFTYLTQQKSKPFEFQVRCNCLAASEPWIAMISPVESASIAATSAADGNISPILERCFGFTNTPRATRFNTPALTKRLSICLMFSVAAICLKAVAGNGFPLEE